MKSAARDPFYLVNEEIQELATAVFGDILDSVIMDVASEAHRAARLGFDRRLNTEEEEELWLSAQARAIAGDSAANGDTSSKYTVDVFGRSHQTVASEIFDCMNCGRPIVAGRFAPHLEKCMGKGRKARVKANANISLGQQRKVRSHALLPSYVPGGTINAFSCGRIPQTQPSSSTPEDAQKVGLDRDDGTSEESHEEDDKVIVVK